MAVVGCYEAIAKKPKDSVITKVNGTPPISTKPLVVFSKHLVRSGPWFGEKGRRGVALSRINRGAAEQHT